MQYGAYACIVFLPLLFGVFELEPFIQSLFGKCTFLVPSLDLGDRHGVCYNFDHSLLPSSCYAAIRIHSTANVIKTINIWWKIFFC